MPLIKVHATMAEPIHLKFELLKMITLSEKKKLSLNCRIDLFIKFQHIINETDLYKTSLIWSILHQLSSILTHLIKLPSLILTVSKDHQKIQPHLPVDWNRTQKYFPCNAMHMRIHAINPPQATNEWTSHSFTRHVLQISEMGPTSMSCPHTRAER